MEAHINSITKKSFYHLTRIRQIKKYISKNLAESLIHSFISSSLDYCNSLFYKLPKYQIEKLQHVQNSAARLLISVPKHHSITPHLKDLNWLKVEYRIIFKIALITYKTIKYETPDNLHELITPYEPNRVLRSSSKNLLKEKKTNTKTIGCRAFSSAAPSIWNNLPLNIRNSTSVDTFKKSLKTYLYKKCYCC